MPCYQVNTVSLNFRASNKGLIAKAAHKLGLEFMSGTTLKTKHGTYIYIDGENARCEQQDAEIVNKLRIGYATEVINHSAQKLGWQKVSQTPMKLTLKKGV